MANKKKPEIPFGLQEIPKDQQNIKMTPRQSPVSPNKGQEGLLLILGGLAKLRLLVTLSRDKVAER